MPQRSLSHRMFAVTGVALLPAIAIILYGVVALRKQAEGELHAAAFRTAELASLELDRIVLGAETVLGVMAAAPAIRDGHFDTCSAVIREMSAAVPFSLSLAVIGSDGQVSCSAERLPTRLFLGDRPYFNEALEAPGRIIGEFTIDRQSGRLVLPIARRIGDKTEPVGSVAVAYLDLEWLQKRLSERTYLPGSSLTVLDKKGIILARVPDPDRFVGTSIRPEFLYLLNEPKPGTLELDSQDGSRRVVGYVPLSSPPTGLYVSAGLSTDMAYAPISLIAARATALATAGVLASFLLAYFTSRSYITRPIQRLIDTLDAWRNGRTDARTGMDAAEGEIGAAGAAFDVFIEELLASRAARRKSEKMRALMSGELDHRIKNLLTMVQVIARQTFPKGDDEHALQTFTHRLAAIGEANDLLRKEQWQSASLVALVQSAMSPFVDLDGERVRIEGNDVPIQGSAAVAISMAFHELCTNALKYGAWSNTTGVVSVTWTVEGAVCNGSLVLTWQESGGPSVDSPKSTGFGSSMIQRMLAAQLDGEVGVDYRPTGLVVELRAPVANLIVAPHSDAA